MKMIAGIYRKGISLLDHVLYPRNSEMSCSHPIDSYKTSKLISMGFDWLYDAIQFLFDTGSNQLIKVQSARLIHVCTYSSGRASNPWQASVAQISNSVKIYILLAWLPHPQLWLGAFFSFWNMSSFSRPEFSIQFHAPRENGWERERERNISCLVLKEGPFKAFLAVNLADEI